MTRDIPLLDGFTSDKAIIEPSEVVQPGDVPEAGVICFYNSVMRQLVADAPDELEPVITMMGHRPIYRIEHAGRPLLMFCPGITAPLAVAVTEEIIARGCRKFIAVGSAGVLDRSLLRGHLVLPTSALRDEGTSFHYVPPSRHVEPTDAALGALRSVLDERGLVYTAGMTWTTDAFYRETPDRIARRKAEGCLTVEMEAAALFALARFRGIELAQLLYCGDDVSGAEWDPRDKAAGKITPMATFELAAEAALRL